MLFNSPHPHPPKKKAEGTRLSWRAHIYRPQRGWARSPRSPSSSAAGGRQVRDRVFRWLEPPALWPPSWCWVEWTWDVPIKACPTCTWWAVSVSLGCHNKIPQTGWLNQWKLIFSQLWRLEARDQGASTVGFWWELSSWLVDGTLLSAHMVERASKLSGILLSD